MEQNCVCYNQVELLDLLSGVDFKLVSYLESMCAELAKGNHHFVGVSTQFRQYNTSVRIQV